MAPGTRCSEPTTSFSASGSFPASCLKGPWHNLCPPERSEGSAFQRFTLSAVCRNSDTNFRFATLDGQQIKRQGHSTKHRPHCRELSPAGAYWKGTRKTALRSARWAAIGPCKNSENMPQIVDKNAHNGPRNRPYLIHFIVDTKEIATPSPRFTLVRRAFRQFSGRVVTVRQRVRRPGFE